MCKQEGATQIARWRERESEGVVRLTLISEDRVSVGTDGGQCLEDSHEDLVIHTVLVVTQEPLKLLMDSNQDL